MNPAECGSENQTSFQALSKWNSIQVVYSPRGRRQGYKLEANHCIMQVDLVIYLFSRLTPKTSHFFRALTIPFTVYWQPNKRKWEPGDEGVTLKVWWSGKLGKHKGGHSSCAAYYRQMIHTKGYRVKPRGWGRQQAPKSKQLPRDTPWTQSTPWLTRWICRWRTWTSLREIGE